MRATRILASVVTVVAFSAFTAAQAAASPEFNAEKYPATVEGASLNAQGFAGTGIASSCKKATASNTEEGIVLPTKNSPTLELHPKYEECKLSLLGLAGESAEVVTTGCNYVFHAVKPLTADPTGEELKTKTTGTTDIKCSNKVLPATTTEVTEKSKIVKAASTTGINPFEIVTGTKIKTGAKAGEKTYVEKVINATEFELNTAVEGAGSAGVKEAVTITHSIQIKVTGGCTVFVPAQNGLGPVGYRNAPAGPPGEVTIYAEVEKISTGIAGVCGTGKIETESEYREGEEVPPTGTGVVVLAPKGKQAKFQSKGKSGVEPNFIEVGINEAHWYENKVLMGKQSGTELEPGTKVIMWGKLTLSGAGEIGSAACLTEWGGNVYNPGGGGLPPGGSAAAGEMKILAMHVYNCTEDVTCEQAGANKVSVVPEGLGVVGKEELSWEGKLLESPPRLHIGNKAGEPAKQIQWQVKCTGATGKYNEKWTGELKPELSDGTSIGAAPSKFLFATAGGLKVGLEAEGGIVGGNLKMMGFEGAELISHKNP